MNHRYVVFKNNNGAFEEWFNVYFFKIVPADLIVILLGIVGTVVLWNGLVGSTYNFNWVGTVVSLVPSILSLLLIVKKSPVAPYYIHLIWFFTLKKEKKNNISKKVKKTKKEGSKLLGFAPNYTIKNITEDEMPEVFICDNLDIPKEYKIQLRREDGSKLANYLVKAYIDEILTDSLNTDTNGEIVIYITPKTTGAKKLVIKNKMGDVLRQRILDFQYSK